MVNITIRKKFLKHTLKNDLFKRQPNINERKLADAKNDDYDDGKLYKNKTYANMQKQRKLLFKKKRNEI